MMRRQISQSAAAAQNPAYNPNARAQAQFMSQGAAGQAAPQRQVQRISAQPLQSPIAQINPAAMTAIASRQRQIGQAMQPQAPVGGYNNNNIGPLLQQFAQPYGGFAPFMSQPQAPAPRAAPRRRNLGPAPFMSQPQAPAFGAAAPRRNIF